MKYTISKLFVGALLLGAVSCTTNYQDINSNPYQPGDLSADDYALGSAMNSLASGVISSDVNTAQFTEALMGGPLAGYFAPANAGWKNTVSNYNPTDDWTNVLLKSDKVIPVIYTNLGIIRTVSEQTGSPVPLAIANIIKVAAMHRITDTYGPIPYSQIGADGSINTPYDSVESIYMQFFDELDEAIATLNENAEYKLVATADYVYYGDIKKWIRYANSLKLRLAIRIAGVSPDVAREKAEEAVNDPGGLITSNADNAAWHYFGSVQNPLYVAVNYNRVSTHDDGTACTSTGDTHAAADLVCYMNGYNDPRREKYFTPSEWPGYGYVGLRHGIVIPEHASVGHKYSGPNFKADDALQWMNAAEVAFLRAEGVAVYGFNMGGTAQEFYEQGVRLSFEQWGVEGAESYLAQEDALPETYDDPSGSNDYNVQLSNLSVKWEEGSVEQMQERCLIQKWIANYPLGNEAWADYRRTGFPHLIPATAAGNMSNGEVDSNRGARRMRYPLDEYVGNAQNVQNAVSTLLGGPDLMSTDLWWARKN